MASLGHNELSYPSCINTTTGGNKLILNTTDSRYIAVEYNTIMHTAQQLRSQSFGYSSENTKDTPISLLPVSHGCILSVIWRKVTVRYRERTLSSDRVQSKGDWWIIITKGSVMRTAFSCHYVSINCLSIICLSITCYWFRFFITMTP